jgi:DNA-binding NarL/FixJ family response regulator
MGSRDAAAEAKAGQERRSYRVVLAEDDVLLREGLARLLAAHGFEVVGQAGDAAELIELAGALAPDLVIVDVRMPPDFATEGLEAANRLRREHPGPGIVVLSATELLAGGAGTGYLLKGRVTNVEDFIEAVERVAGGGSIIDPELVRELISANRRDDPLAALTGREREVLALMAEGRSNSGIARRLWVTEGTVEKHVRSVLGKLPIPGGEDDHRRVLAVVMYLNSR